MKVFTYEQYKDMKAQGKSNKEIAKELNISEGTLYARLKAWKEPFGNSSIKQQEAEIKLKTDSENNIREEKTPENESSKDSNDDVRLLHETIAEKNGIIQELQRKLNEMEMPVIDPDSIEAECESLANLLIKKNHDYGNSVQEQFDEYGLISILIRLDDKLKRLKNLVKNTQKIQNESLLDTMKDIAGYGVLGSILLNKKV